MSDLAISDPPAPPSRSPPQRRAEAAVDAAEQVSGPFAVAAETTRMPMVFTRVAAGHPIIFANAAFTRLFGFAHDEIVGQPFQFALADPGDAAPRGEIASAFEKCTEAEPGDDPDICFRRNDGRSFWATVMINPVRDAGGAVVQHFASFVDLTRHRAERAQARLLIDELNHRVKNTLATVQAIVTQGLRGATDPAAIRAAIESRVFALSRSHDLLTRETWAGAGLDDIVRAALEPFGVAAGRAERFEIVGPEIRMPPRATLALGIALHELATNAVKYGAFSNDAGCVRISWSTTGGTRPRLALCWVEEGGPPVVPPARRGFGARVLERGLAHELDGAVSLDFRPGGVVCTIDLPLPLAAGSANDA